MKTYTASELKFERTKIFNEVQDKGAVAIAHRDRPLMVLMTQRELTKRLDRARTRNDTAGVLEG